MANAFEQYIIPESAYVDNDVASLPDDPSAEGYSATNLKDAFDKAVKRIVGDTFNSFVSAIMDPNAAESIGAVSSSGETSTIQAELNKFFSVIIERGAGDMLRGVYDTNNNGVVDNAERLQGLTISEILLSQRPVGSLYMSIDPINPNTLFGGTWELYKPGRVIVCVDTSDDNFNAPNKVGGSKEIGKHSHSGTTGNPTGPHGHALTIYDTTFSHLHAMPHRHTGTAGSAGRHTHNLYSPGYAQSTIPSDRYGAAGGRSGSQIGNISYADPHEHNVSVGEPTNANTSSANTTHKHTGTVGNDSGPHTHSFNTSEAGTGNFGNLMPFATAYVWVRTA